MNWLLLLILGAAAEGAALIRRGRSIVGVEPSTLTTRQSLQFARADIAAGDVLDVRVRTGSGWTSSTVDLAVAVEIAD